MKYSLPPPQHWQDFQDLTLAVAKHQHPDASVLIYGREGQDQQGIDVYIEGKRIGIQAKNRRLFNANGKVQPNGQIDIEDVKSIAEGAEEFEPTLNKLIIATSALTDAKLQNQVILLNEERKNIALFPIEFWFWESFQAEINNHQDLLELHYARILPKVPGFDSDAVLLATVCDAFHRPALITPARCENCGDDFLQALKDVQEALATGVSVDRETRQIRSRAIYGYPQAKDSQLGNHLKTAWENLQEARNVFTRGLSSRDNHGHPAIEQRNNFIQIRDPRIEHQLNDLRKRAIHSVNAALKLKKCPPILERDWF